MKTYILPNLSDMNAVISFNANKLESPIGHYDSV